LLSAEAEEQLAKRCIEILLTGGECPYMAEPERNYCGIHPRRLNVRGIYGKKAAGKKAAEKSAKKKFALHVGRSHWLVPARCPVTSNP
jgi:hypothetical protein